MLVENRLSPKQEKAIIALLTFPSILEAARDCGIAETTLHRWLKGEAFQASYREARREVVQQAIVGLQVASAEAVQVLRSCMNDAIAPPHPRITAARVILEMSLRAVYLESVEVRLSSLEKQAKEKRK